ncbi:MAG TPA: glycosyltransferase family 2 protein [Methylibium sp.]|nr:glycosyltransferase family 2 protein [Methylibium sp.]
MAAAPGPTRLLISIVAYQAADLTIACLASIEPELASLPGTRVVVVDNASPDGAAEPVERAIAERGWGAWATLVRAPRNAGFAAGNNIAIRRLPAEAEFVLLLNPDTVVRPGALRLLLDFLVAHPEAGIAGGRSEDPDATPQMCCFRFPNALSEALDRLGLGLLDRLFERHLVRLGIPEQPRPVDWVSGAFMLVRRAVIDRIGLMDEGYFLYFEETDFTLRARCAGWTCWHVPQARIVHLVGQSSGVTVREGAPRRVPSYWFESRRRYFVLNHGRAYAALADLLVLAADPIGRLRHWLQRKPQRRPPHYWCDLACHSAVWRGVAPRSAAERP